MTAPVLSATSPLLWYTTRASGVVALVLLTGAVVGGLLTSARLGTPRWPRFALADLHRRVSLLAVVFVALHVATAASDTFVPIGWLAVVIPFTSGYDPLWVGLGTVALDALVAVIVTSLVRSRLPQRLWRKVHWLAYLSWPLAVAHGLALGTDTGFVWATALVAACGLAVAAALTYRVVARAVRPGPALTAAASPAAAELARRRAPSPTRALR